MFKSKPDGIQKPWTTIMCPKLKKNVCFNLLPGILEKQGSKNSPCSVNVDVKQTFWNTKTRSKACCYKWMKLGFILFRLLWPTFIIDKKKHKNSNSNSPRTIDRKLACLEGIILSKKILVITFYYAWKKSIICFDLKGEERAFCHNNKWQEIKVTQV